MTQQLPGMEERGHHTAQLQGNCESQRAWCQQKEHSETNWRGVGGIPVTLCDQELPLGSCFHSGRLLCLSLPSHRDNRAAPHPLLLQPQLASSPDEISETP